MNNTGSEIKIVICGTRKSMFLDPNEKQVMKFAPGEPFRDGINTLDDHPVFVNYDPSDLRERVMEEASFLD